jgi:hypothetical protein
VKLGPVRLSAPACALLLYVACLYGATSLLQRGLFERDGYYHARLAELLPERGLSRSFPWTQLSIWKDRYCDKEVLFHVAMAPFAAIGAEPILGARLFLVLLSTAVVLALYLVLRAHGVPWPAFFAALPLASGGLFLARLGMIRSHVLSMALLVLGAHLLLRRRWRALLALGFVYAWSYTVPFVLVLTAVPFVLGCRLRGAPLDWRSVLAAGGGAVLGLAVHPYSPLTLETLLTIVQIVRMGVEGAGRSGVELGNEIYPYPLPVLWNIYPLAIVLAVALVGIVASRLRRLSPEAVGVSVAATAWAAATLLSARYVEYQVLLLALALGLVTRDLARADGPERRLALHPRWRLAVAAIALAALAGFHARSMRFYASYQTTAAPARFFDGAAAWMAGNLAPGETVINLYWDDFPDLFYSAPRQRFLWGLDPTFSLRADPWKTMLLERSRRREVPLVGPVLSAAFGSRWLVLRAARADRHPDLGGPPFREVYRDASAVVYRIDAPGRVPAAPSSVPD